MRTWPGLERLEGLEPAAQRVAEAQAHRGTTLTRQVGADGASGALVAGQVAGRGLDRDPPGGRRPVSCRDGGGHGVEASAAEARPCAQDGDVDAVDGRGPRRSRRAMTSATSARLSMPRVVGLTRREEAARGRRRRPPPGAPSQSAWRTTSPSEWPCSRGAPSMSRPPRRRPSCGPKGWLSEPRPRRDPGPCAGQQPRQLEVLGQRHLDVAGLALDDRGRGRRARASSSASSGIVLRSPGMRARGGRERARVGRPGASGRGRGRRARRRRR